MPLINAKCTNCGSNLQVDNTKDALICDYCGSPFIVEKAINNYNTTNNIQANVVNIYGGNSANFVIRAGKLEKYTGESTEVVIPDTVTIIGYGAFSDCTGLKSVIIPSTVTEIEGAAFCNCRGLMNVTIPPSVLKIGRNAFCKCSGVTNITIPASVKKIGDGAFSDCDGLTSITIPASVEEIGYGAFDGCVKLGSINCSSDIEPEIFEGSAWFQGYMCEIEARETGRCPNCFTKLIPVIRKCPKCKKTFK